jgi:deoxyadenosine/deoxycytidine kinase
VTTVEDLVKWQAVPGCEGDGHLLVLFYGNPKQWAHNFESYVLMTKAERHQLVVPTRMKLLERSVHSAAFVFCKHLKDPRLQVDLWVYLRTPADLAIQRIGRRGRPKSVHGLWVA